MQILTVEYNFLRENVYSGEKSPSLLPDCLTLTYLFQLF